MSSMRNGALAGLVGTAAMTAAQAVEMKLSGRPPSTVPGQVASRLLRVTPKNDAQMMQMSTGMHWANGISQGLVRAGVGKLGLSGLGAAATHFALMWTSNVALYKALDIADWPWHWTAAELAPDLLHKGSHAVVTSMAYDRLS